MVDSIKHSLPTGSTAINEHKKSRIQVDDAGGASHEQAQSGKTQGNSVDLSLNDIVKDLSNEPPINLELVNEIRQKVSEGRYPLDLDAISDKLFENITDA